MGVSDDDYVIGVEHEGAARAYPLNMLSRPDHHVVDDTLGGRPIAITWCGLCQSPVVYDRTVDGKTLTLFVSGELYGENMMMRDVETGSDWPQIMGQAIHGPLAGKALAQLPSVWTDWKTWRTQHPDSTLLQLEKSVDYYRHDTNLAPAPLEARYLSSLQWGHVQNGQAFSWPLKELSPRAAVNENCAGLPLVVVYESESTTITAFERRLGDLELTFHWEADGLIDDQTSSVWDPVTGRALKGKFANRQLTPVAGIVSHQRAWRASYPNTLIRTLHAG